MNDKTKKLTKFILIAVIVLIVIVIYLISSMKKGNQGSKSSNNENNKIESNNKESNNKKSSEYTPIENVKYHLKIEKADKVHEFFNAERCIQSYISALCRTNKNIYSGLDQNTANKKIDENKQHIYSMLDEEYIQKYNLTINNMDERFSQFYNTMEFLTENMYVLDKNDTHESIYFVYGDLVNITKNTIQQYGFIVRKLPRCNIFIYNNSL